MTTDPDPVLLGSHFRDEWKRLGLLTDAPPAPRAPEPDLAAQVKAQRMATFRNFCPAQFQQRIDRTKIPNLAAWDLADKWNGTFPGVWLWSHSTGEAKTRMLWRKYGQLHVEQGRVVSRITGLNLAEFYHDCYRQNRTSEFYHRITKFDVLMLDDLDKIPLPQGDLGYSAKDAADMNARMLREVFDHLYEAMKAVLVTSNEPISYFAERCGPSTERRMREACINEICFDNPAS